MGETITTTSSSTNFWVTNETSTGWHITINGAGLADPLKALRDDFQKLSTKFFEKQGAVEKLPERNPERLIAFYDRMADDETIAALMS